ncbi:hypothetical protein Clacol_009698 [Clathrus columnatus]|uniref:ARID domain-containing protein n=1 Tax=Clathrus columnatus TaxID=1419009 RepID=A0AAV5AL92_9AGAM|nr:hypothetical protein Clacol_009698 [Clathrus columnatus]
MAQQRLSSQQASHVANIQINAVPHQSVVPDVSHGESHQSTGGMPQTQLNRRMYTGGSTNTLPGRSPASGPTQPGAANIVKITTRRRVELQVAALQQDILKSHKMLSDIGWFSGMAGMTDQQRQLAAEYEQKKSLYDRYRRYMDPVLSQVIMPANGQGISNPATSNIKQREELNRPPSDNFQQDSIQNPPSFKLPSPQQQPQSIFTPMPQQRGSETGSASGSMFDPQGQVVGGEGLRLPTVSLQSGTAAVTAQSNPTAYHTHNQDQAPISQGTQGIPSNVNAHPPTGAGSNAEKAAFDTQLKAVLDRFNLTVDSRDLLITQEVQLHQLFLEVMERGANAAVTQNNAWAIIGASLGFVQFPANGGEPARSSTHIAQHLQYIYQKYLFPYEQMYLTQLSQEKRRLLMQRQPQSFAAES